jgi:pimeloyl-ACP methyl ester carboxylesterase
MHRLVMLPAMGCDQRLYASLAGRLDDTATAYVIADGDDMSVCVSQVLRAAPPMFILLGTSFGGRVALETSLAAPTRVVGLIVIGSGARPVADPAAGWRRVERMRGNEFPDVVREMGDMVSHLPGPHGPATRDAFLEMAKDMGPARMSNQAEAMATRGDVRERLPDIFCPALMLWGAEDKFSPASDGLAMAAAMPHGRYVEIADCGHFPSLEAPEETAAIIRHWLADHFTAPQRAE